MGRPRSCFQIITCASDSKDDEEIDVLESKDSKDKRGWSFRKRSSQHRVLNNTVIAEAPPVEKENLETATIDFQSSANSTVPEKPTIVHFSNEETHLPNIENPKGFDKVDVASENESKVDTDCEVKESNAIVIQAGIRGILAQRDLLNLKSVVKVQAAFRGFLVRRHAVGTLRCAQAIVKMQAIVRARRAQLSLDKSAQGEIYKKNEKGNPGSKIAVKGEMTKSRYISIEKLLSNNFARQLMESTPKNKPINIKCDPSKNDSAWKWLERWMAVSSLDVLVPEKEESVTEQMEGETDQEPRKGESVTEIMESETDQEPRKGESVTEIMESETEELKKEESVTQKMENETEEPKKKESVTPKMESETEEPKKEESVTEQVQREIEESHVEDRVDSKGLSETEDLNSITIKSVSPSESEDLLTYDANNFQFQTSHSPSLSVGDNMEQPQPENVRTSESEETSTMVSSVQDQKIQFDDAGLQTVSNSSSDKPQMYMEQVNPLKRLAPEQLENEGKKFVLGARKVSNPSFITAQAKFEQLSSAPDSIGTISSMHQDDEIEPHSETVSSTLDAAVLETKEPSANETIVLPGSRIVQVGGSECGTEISISSTLDSPDISEAGVADQHVTDVSKKEVQDPSSDLSTEVEIKGSSTTALQNDFQPEEASESNGHSVTSVPVVDSAPSESKLERRSSDQQREQEEAGTGHGRQTYRSSPEASPRSHLTVPESQGTPSSQVSTKTKRDKTDKTGSYQKQKSSSAIKKSPSSLNRNSGTRSNAESSYKDQKSGKRRNSFDSARPETVEHELKESSSSNSLPRFMQATQSAKAKLQSTNSPRSSPDVEDTELYIKKRHSLPADVRQGSPRVQQPTPRAQQGVKGNDKMWRR